MIPKFRVYDKWDKVMKYVESIEWNRETKFDELELIGTVDSTDENFTEFKHPDWFILMQSTGLHDKNGVEVYEDDIVRCSRGCPHRVIWVKEYGGSFLGGMPAWYLSGLNEGYSWTGAEEIIGNSWETPELLEDVE